MVETAPAGDGLGLGGLVSDWGGFELLVAELNRTGEVSDCKYWKERVGRLHVDALATAVRDLNASRGVLFSIKGFESGAVTQAKSEGIDLFTVREPTNEEWGLPGRHIDFFITYLSKTFGNLSTPGSQGIGIQGPVSLNLNFGDDANTSRTPIQPTFDLPDPTFENLMDVVVQRAAMNMWKPQVLFGGRNGTRKFWRPASAIPQSPVVMRQAGGTIFIPAITFDVGISAHQTRFQLDRGARFTFVLAVEDCVRGVTTAAARERGEKLTSHFPLHVEGAEGPPGVLTNGSIMSIWLKGLFNFEELVGLSKGEYRDTIDP